MPVVLVTAHPRWREFAGRLTGPEGCDFHEDEHGAAVWRCDGTPARARSILRSMNVAADPVDVDGTLAYCASNGGHCDCEILFNVDPETTGTDGQGIR